MSEPQITKKHVKPLRAAGGKFAPGSSGNPGGRPEGEVEVRELARKRGPWAIRRLTQLARSKNERVAVAACQALLDRGYGRPPQSIALSDPNGKPLAMPNFAFAITFDDGGPGQQSLPRQDNGDDDVEISGPSEVSDGDMPLGIEHERAPAVPAPGAALERAHAAMPTAVGESAQRKIAATAPPDEGSVASNWAQLGAEVSGRGAVERLAAREASQPVLEGQLETLSERQARLRAENEQRVATENAATRRGLAERAWREACQEARESGRPPPPRPLE